MTRIHRRGQTGRRAPTDFVYRIVRNCLCQHSGSPRTSPPGQYGARPTAGWAVPTQTSSGRSSRPALRAERWRSRHPTSSRRPRGAGRSHQSGLSGLRD